MAIKQCPQRGKDGIPDAIARLDVAFDSLFPARIFNRLLMPKPAVVISDAGIFDNASAVGAGMLKWEEIADVFACDFMGQRWLGIIPMNEEVILGRQSRLK